jgi:pyridoxine 4-dehydrogenase
MTPQLTVHSSGTFQLGGDLTIHRLGFGTMQLPGPGVWGPTRSC